MKLPVCMAKGRKLLIVMAVAGLLLPGAGAIATPEGSDSESRDHYVPRAGYLRTVDLLALIREPSFRLPAGAPGLVTSLTGRRAVPTILLEFDNVSGPFTSLSYQDHLFGNLGVSPPRATISQYYRDMSLGQFEVTGRVIGWFRLPQSDRHYEGPRHGTGTGFGEFLKFGLDSADQIVDFGDFDNDGPDGLPNSGDDDGIVDTVFFVHPEEGAECQRPGGILNIWSHSWHYSEPTYGHTGMYQTNDVKLDRLQVPELNDDGSVKHIRVEDYTVQPGLACPDNTGIAKIVPIGVFTHEYGHALGLPDLYDRTPSSNPNSNGIGDWGLMAGGSWGFGRHPEMPTRMSSWSLARLGWAQLEFIDPSSSDSLTLEPVQQRNLVHVIDVPATNGNEYFLLETKDPNWTDSLGMRLNWDIHVPDEGIAIWHVDDSVGASSPTWPFAPRGAGQNDDPSIPGSDKHSLLALEQRDCALNLEFKNNEGDNSDLWGTGTSFGDSGCHGGSIAYDGNATGTVIENIDMSQLSADLKMQVSGLPPSAPALVEVAADDRSDDAVAVGRPAVAAAPARAELLGPSAIPERRNLAQMSLSTSPARREVQAAMQDSFGDVNQSLATNASIDDLSVNQQAELRNSPAIAIEYGVDIEQQKTVKAWASQQRQYQIAAEYQPQSEFQTNLKDLWQASGGDTPLNAQLDATQTRVDRVWGLDIPSSHETVAADADERQQTTLEPLLGDKVQLRKISSDPDANAQTFQQIYKYQNTELPVFAKQASLHYDQSERLKAITADTVDESTLNVTGTSGGLNEQQANKIVTEQLGLPSARAEKLKDSGEGIYLVNDDATKARIVRRILLPAPGDRADIVIYVDEETQTVIGIE